MPRTLSVPPHAFFLVSAVCHYLGPACAVLLFAHVDVLGVAWLRIASAALVFVLWRRPWRAARAAWRPVLALGVVLAAMNTCFYLAIDRLPLGTVGAIEFLGPVTLAALGARSPRNILALVLAAGGGLILTQISLSGDPLGLLLAATNCALFVLYVVLGHTLARDGGEQGVDRLALAMLCALVVVTPVGLRAAWPTFSEPNLLVASVGVGVLSSVVPYVCDQLAMSRLPRSTFALLLALLPALATLIGALVLIQIPTPLEGVGIGLIGAGVALHRAR